MQISFLFVFTGLILIGYLFEIISPKTRIPNILILLGLGMLSQQLVETFHWQKPNFDKLLPELGTVGLILIVLEGTLELNLTRSKIPLLKKTVSLAFFSIVSLSLTFGAYFFYQGYPLKQSILNALPLTIISSAIAIPTAKMLSQKDKEFIIFESSLSDILGVTIFNFFLINEVVNLQSLINFGGEVIISVLFSISAAILLIFVLSRLKHKVKFMPIIALVLFLYAFAKGYHLPGLILILTFGLVLANIEKLNLIPFLKEFNITHLKSEIMRFEEITVELTFIVRVAFFLIFGFTIELSSLFDLRSLLLSLSGFFIIIFFRVVQLLLMKLPLIPLAFVAPRGLITILLFVSIPSSNKILFINQTVITQVIIISSLFMMIATMTVRTKTKKEELNP
jgi:potassium/hydrogen antiporter